MRYPEEVSLAVKMGRSTNKFEKLLWEYMMLQTSAVILQPKKKKEVMRIGANMLRFAEQEDKKKWTHGLYH